jgi:hypothetical protein
MKKAKRLGDLQLVDNTNQHWAANAKYNYIRVQKEDGKEVSLLFTDKEILRAAERAAKNPEDLPVVSKFRNLFD